MELEVFKKRSSASAESSVKSIPKDIRILVLKVKDITYGAVLQKLRSKSTGIQLLRTYIKFMCYMTQRGQQPHSIINKLLTVEGWRDLDKRFDLFKTLTGLSHGNLMTPVIFLWAKDLEGEHV